MTNANDYVVGADASIIDVDLDADVVTVKGRRLTEAGGQHVATVKALRTAEPELTLSGTRPRGQPLSPPYVSDTVDR